MSVLLCDALVKHLIPCSGGVPGDSPLVESQRILCFAQHEDSSSLLRPSSKPMTPVSVMETQGQAVDPPEDSRGKNAHGPSGIQTTVWGTPLSLQQCPVACALGPRVGTPRGAGSTGRALLPAPALQSRGFCSRGLGSGSILPRCTMELEPSACGRNPAREQGAQRC